MKWLWGKRDLGDGASPLGPHGKIEVSPSVVASLGRHTTKVHDGYVHVRGDGIASNLYVFPREHWDDFVKLINETDKALKGIP